MRLKTPRFRSRAYLEHVASLGCCICGQPGIGHHLLRGSGHGMGLKAGDDMTICLCDVHHRELHHSGNETEYLQSYGIDGAVEAMRIHREWEIARDD